MRQRGTLTEQEVVTRCHTPDDAASCSESVIHDVIHGPFVNGICQRCKQVTIYPLRNSEQTKPT